MTQPTAQQRQDAAIAALASVALDDLEPTEATRDLLEAAVRGELTADELYERVLRRAREGGEQ